MIQLLIIIMVKGQAWEQHLYPLPIGGRQVKEVLHPRKGSHRIVSRDGTSDLNTELVDKGGGLGLHAGELDKPKSVAGKTTTMNATKRINVSTSSHRMGWYRLFFCSERTWKAADDPGRAGRRVPESSRIGDGNINVLSPRYRDDACIGASVPGVPFDDATVAIVLNGRSPAREVEVIIPALGIGSQVNGAVRMGGGRTRGSRGRMVVKRLWPETVDSRRSMSASLTALCR